VGAASRRDWSPPEAPPTETKIAARGASNRPLQEELNDLIAWVLLQAADFGLDMIEAPNWVVQALFLLASLGLVGVLIFSWVFEMTPEGIKKESDIDRASSITPQTGRKLDRVIIAALGLLVVYFVIDKVLLQDQAPTAEQAAIESSSRTGKHSEPDPGPISEPIRDNSIAVLPFANRSRLEDDEFFTDGIHDDLLTQLAQIDDLKVISRTSVMEYRDTTKKISEIASELGVSTILEGGVQRAGNRVRINAQLIDVATDEHLWAQTFDREMTIENIFDIQSEISRQIVTAVKGELSAEEQQRIDERPTDNLAAWEAYLHGKAAVTAGGYTVDTYIQAEPWVQRAVELDPNFARAWALLAQIYLNRLWIGEYSPELRELARQTTDRAAQLAADDPIVISAQAEFLYRAENDYEQALQMFNQAAEDAPGDSNIWNNIAALERRLGRWEDAVDHFYKAWQLDPRSVNAGFSFLQTLSALQDWERMDSMVEELMRAFPASGAIKGQQAQAMLWGRGDLEETLAFWALVPPEQRNEASGMKSNLLVMQEDWEGAIEWIQDPEQNLQRMPMFNPINLLAGEVHHWAGNEEEARWHFEQYLDEVRDQPRDQPMEEAFRLAFMGWAYAYLGDRESALAAARAAEETAGLDKDQVFGMLIYQFNTHTLAKAGEMDEALARYEAELGTPVGFVPWQLRLHPRFAFLREDPRFIKLISGDGWPPAPKGS
jgi:TolB-like protein/thioredoxin-like negative regulator of GroEL